MEKKTIVFSLVISLLFMVAGCGKGLLGSGRKQGLERRVKIFIQALEANDYQTRYSFMDPDFKKKVSLLQFSKPSRVRFSDVRLQDITWKKEGEMAVTRFTATLVYNNLKFRNVPLLRTWEYLDGQWFITDSGQDPNVMFRPSKK